MELLISFIVDHCDKRTTHKMMSEILEMLLSQKIKTKVIKGFFSRYMDLDEFSYSLEQPLADDDLPILAAKADFCVPITSINDKRLKEAMIDAL